MTNLIALPSGTELVGDYRIERVLGAGGFGVTYLADELALDRHVTIKEYFPSDIAARAGGIEAAPRSQDCAGDYRWGLDRFIEEAQTLAKFDHTNIVRVYRYFRANNTGYMVLQWEEGQSLKGWLTSLGRAPRQKELDEILAPLLDALEFIHKADFLHRDIAPDNVIIRKSGEPVLIDFGSARGEIASQTRTVSALVKPGYSPYEQYAETSRRQGPWTDIYALGATLYHAVTGKRPPDAPSRMVNDEIVPVRDAALSSYRAGFLKAIDRALQLSIEARPQSIAVWRAELLSADLVKTGWLTRGREKARKEEVRKEEVRKVEPVLEAPPPPRPEPELPAPKVLPMPDAPAQRGGLLDYLDSLRDTRDPGHAKAVAPPPRPAPAPRAPMTPKPEQASVKTVRMEALPPLPQKPKRKAAAKKAEQPKARAVPAAAARKPVRPRPVKGSRRRWVSLAFKLLVGVGVASAAVAMQDRFPSFETRGSSVPSSQTTPATTGSTARTGGSEQAQSAAFSTPMAEIAAHRGGVIGMAYTEDGRWLVTAGRDATLKVWDATSHALARALLLEKGRATSLAVSGTRAATGHADGTIVVWDVAQGTKLATVRRNEANIWAVVFTGDGNKIAAASHDWKITLWDLAQPAMPTHVFDGHENAVQALAFTPQQMLLASGSADETVRLWDLQTLTMKRRYRGHRDFISAIEFSRSGRMIASGSLDGAIRVWSALSSRRLRALSGHTKRITDIAFAPTGNLLASASDDGTVRLWDLNRARTLRTLAGHAGGATAVAFAPDGQHLASAGENGVVRLWTMPIGQLARE